MASNYRKSFYKFLRRTPSLSHPITDALTRDTPLPTFCIAGATRSGTSTLYRMLDQHPDIHFAERKEINFFNTDARYRQGLRCYRTYFREHSGETAIGEASPLYLTKGLIYRNRDRQSRYFSQTDSALCRLAHHLPQTRIIVTLRSPVSRYISEFTKSLYQSKQGIANDIGTQYRLDRYHLGSSNERSLLFFNKYEIHLQHLLEIFPKHQVRLLIFEEWLEEPINVCQKLFSFLGVSSGFAPLPPEATNAALEYNRSRKPEVLIEPEIRQSLQEEFDTDIKFVESFVGRRIPTWHK